MSAHSIDLWRLGRRLLAWPTLGLLVAGAVAGLAVRQLAGETHSVAVSWKFAPVVCPAHPGPLPASFMNVFTFPSAFVGLSPAATFDCRLDAETLVCEVLAASDEDAAQAVGSAAVALETPSTTMATRIAGMRLGNVCGTMYPAQDPEFISQRTAAATGAQLVDETGRLPGRMRYPWAPLLALIAAGFAAALLAAWRSRAPAPSPPAFEERLSVAANLALAGLMLTCSMTKVLIHEIGPFKLRFGQGCVLVLFVLAVAERRRLRAALALPAAPVLAAIAYLGLAALSAVFSENPLKSAGYLGWAAFDVLVVFGGLTLWICNTARLKWAVGWWLAGMGTAVAMGAVQFSVWALGYPPPLMEWDTLGLPRMNGFSYEPAYFALYLVPGVLVLLCLAARQGKRGLGFGLLAVAFLVAIALSTSRSGWLGVAVGVALMLLLLAVRAGRGPALRLALASLAGLAVCAMVMAASPALRAHLTRFAKMGVDVNERTSSAPRLEAMAEAATIFRQHPVLGVGFAGYGGYTINHPVGLTRTDRGPFKLVTANLYLELAAETGALGLAAALWLLWVLIAPLLRRSRPDEPPQLVATREGLLLACMVVFLVMFHFNQTLWRLDIWILLALSFAAGTLPGSPAGDRTA